MSKIIYSSDREVLEKVEIDEEEFIVPEGVRLIAQNAFEGCENLKRIILPDSLKGICAFAFAKLKISEITLPKNLTMLGSGAFFGCKKLKKINIDEGNEYFKFTDGVLTSCETIHLVLPTKNITKFEVPRGYTLKGGCFAYNKYLEEVVLNTKMNFVPNDCFYECKNLKSICNTENIASIGSGAFYNCKSLENVKFKNVVNILSSAFQGCVNLKNVQFDNLNKIMNSAFIDCKSLKHFEMKKVTSFGFNVFVGTGFKTFTVPENIIVYHKSNNFYTELFGDKTMIKLYNVKKEFRGPKYMIVPRKVLEENPKFMEDFGDKIIIEDEKLDMLIEGKKSFKEINNTYKELYEER